MSDEQRGQSPATIVTVDVGGTKIRGGLVRGSSVERTRQVASPSSEGPNAMVRAICEMVDRISPRDSSWPIAIATAGTVDRDSGTVVSATSFVANWAGVDLRRRLVERYGVTVTISNDVTAFTVGEARVGSAAGLRSVLGVTVGTGIGAALVIDGGVSDESEALLGKGSALPHFSQGRHARTLLEAVASGSGMEARYAELSSAQVSLPRIVEDAAAGSPLARQVIDEGASALGRALAELAGALDIDAVVLGGSVIHRVPAYFDALSERMSHGQPDHDARVLRGALGEDAALIGASLLALEAKGGIR